jgi:hypothetical protein
LQFIFWRELGSETNERRKKRKGKRKIKRENALGAWRKFHALP